MIEGILETNSGHNTTASFNILAYELVSSFWALEYKKSGKLSELAYS